MGMSNVQALSALYAGKTIRQDKKRWQEIFGWLKKVEGEDRMIDQNGEVWEIELVASRPIWEIVEEKAEEQEEMYEYKRKSLLNWRKE
jgi:hypothetical protein